LKNPWAHKGWKGRFSSRDLESWKDPSFRAEVGYDPDIASLQDDGIFWVCWDDILKYFQNFHLSWNPFLFKFRLVTHGFWPSGQGPKDDTFNVGENPQYIISFSQQAIIQKATIWILISRHVTKQEQNGAEVRVSFIALISFLSLSSCPHISSQNLSYVGNRLFNITFTSQ
jgi:calpain-7